MGKYDYDHLAKKREAAYAAIAAEKARKEEATRKAEQDRRDAVRLRLEKGTFVISVLSFVIAVGAFVVALIALVR